MPWPSSAAPFMAVTWLAALALVAAGSRWSRLAIAAAIGAQVAVGTTEAARYGGPPNLFFTLRFFLPMSLPLLPLVFLPAGRPYPRSWRGGLLSWREALARFGGWRAVLTAVAVLCLNHGIYALLLNLERGTVIKGTEEWAIPAALVVLAVLSNLVPPRRRGALPGEPGPPT